MPQCAAAQIDVNTNTASLSYPAGQPVTLTTTIRNRSSAPCFYRGYDVAMSILDPNLQQLFGTTAHADDVGPQTFAPGQVLTQSATWAPAPTAAPPPGFYSAQATWSFSGGTYGYTRQFVLR